MATSKASALYPNSHRSGQDVALDSGKPKDGWPWVRAAKRPGEPKSPADGGVKEKVLPKPDPKASGRKHESQQVNASAAAKLYPTHGVASRKTR